MLWLPSSLATKISYPDEKWTKVNHWWYYSPYYKPFQSGLKTFFMGHSSSIISVTYFRKCHYIYQNYVSWKNISSKHSCTKTIVAQSFRNNFHKLYHLVSIKSRLKMKIQFIISCVPFLPHITEHILPTHFFTTTKLSRNKNSNLQNLIHKVYIQFWLYTLNFWSIQYKGLINFHNYLTTYPKQDVAWLSISHMKYSVVITSWFDIHWRMSKLGITAISHAINQRGTN